MMTEQTLIAEVLPPIAERPNVTTYMRRAAPDAKPTQSYAN